MGLGADRTATGTALNQAMLLLASQPGVLFLGQSVAYNGIAMFNDLDGVSAGQRIEFPVAEELQLGASIGLAMQGYLPISIFPRVDFLLRAIDQLVNHLDKIKQMSCGQWNPKVIIRTRVGGRKPLDAGPQHTQNHCAPLRWMLKTVAVYELKEVDDILPAYRWATDRDGSTMIVENLSC